MNVVVFGETGSGKSSLVNLLLGRNAAAVSDGATGCTFEFKQYSTDSFNLFDTVGLSERTHGIVNQSFAVEKLIELLKSLEGGVSLLIFVMKKGRITKSLQENYALFVDTICMKKVPVVLVITHCEMDAEPVKWWNENQDTFKSYGWDIRDCVCCCCLNPELANRAMRPVIRSMCESAKTQILDVIEKTKLDAGMVVPGGWKAWLEEILPVVFSIVTGVIYGLFPKMALANTVFQSLLRQQLVDRGYSLELASSMASEIALAVGNLRNPEIQ